MTSDTEQPAVVANDGADGAFVDTAARAYLFVAVLMLVAASVLAVLVAGKLVEPGLLGGAGFLSYGRLRPVAADTLVYGWLTIGLLGAGLYVTPRLARTPLRRERVAASSLGLLVLGYGAGLVAVLAGYTQGRELLELPIWSAGVVLLGLVGAAVSITSTALAAPSPALRTAQWYLTAAVWWLVLTHVAGNLPGIAGINGTIQTAFYRASLTGLFFAAAGVGIVYFLVPLLTGRGPLPPTRIGVAAFWSLAFIWAWTAPRALMYGPAPDWLETVGVVFSFALFVPFVLLGSDFAAGMRGHWHRVAESVALRFVIAGAVLFAMVPVYNLLLALRSSAAVVGLTNWVPGFDVLALQGAITLWLFALVYVAVDGHAGRSGADPLARWHLRLTLTGIGVTFFSLVFAGVQVGFTWVASANNADVASVGVGFGNSVRPVTGLVVAAAVGAGIYAIAQLLALVRVAALARRALPTRIEADFADAAPLDEAAEPVPPVLVRPLLAGAVGLFLIAAFAVWLAPSLDADQTEGSILADSTRIYPSGTPVAQGREVYVQEGCWYCHTQQVRPIVTDVELGPVSLPNDYVHETPAVVGVARLGPDLMHAGSREPTHNAAWVRDHLLDPQADRSWSTMPSYRYLSDADLDAVAAYVSSLE